MFHHRFDRRLASLLLVVVGACGMAGCSSSESKSNSGGKVGSDCATTSECESPLACVFSHCHQTCDRDKDCPDIQRCVSGSGEDHVCQLPEALVCNSDDDCNGKQVCAIDDECRDPCSSADDCTKGQLCAKSKQCASLDPNRDRVDSDGNIVTLADAGGGSGGNGGESDASMPVNDAGGGIDASTPDAAVDGGASGGLQLSNVAVDKLPEAPSTDLRISGDCTFDTDTGDLGCNPSIGVDGDFAYAVVEPDDGSRLAVMRVHSLQVDMSGVLTLRGTLPLVVVSDEAVKIFGRITGVASGSSPVAGGFTAGNGPGAGQRGVTGQFKPSSGGSYCGKGGRGGVPEGSEPGVDSGPAYGNLTITPLLGGSGGGGSTSDPGGAGGGAIQIVSGVKITIGVTGVIDAGGGGGGNGSTGAGAGGALLLEAPDVSVAGVLAVNGGGGGASVGGGGGEDGKPSATPAPAELPNLGGNGSAGDNANGEDGKAETANNSLGGGGGAGRIRINTKTGDAEISGTLSPSIKSKCASLGKLP